VAALSGPTPGLPPGGGERLDPDTAAAETVMLALRTDRGVSEVTAHEPPLDNVAPWAVTTGLLAREGDRLVLTTQGRLLSNELFARLL
jgi:Coproporphyrinogen III oxidase and related Fe-S oxidoreductases